MRKIPFIFKELSIRKTPGFPDGMPKYESFSPNLNIVVGPNASGKSSTARVIRQLIWKQGGNHTEAEAFADIEGETWKIMMDFGSIVTRKNGIQEQLAGLPAPETAGRYMLALHELIQADEKALASHIVRESIGGYDLDQAEQTLGYADHIRSKTSSEYKRVEEATDHYQKIRQQQLDLKKEEDKLDRLYGDRERAREAAKEKDFFERLIEYLQARHDYKHFQEEFLAYPREMENMHGEEYNTIIELENKITDAKGEIEQAQKRRKESEKVLSNLSLPENGLNDQVLYELENYIGKLEEKEHKVEETRQKISDQEKKAKEALKTIDESINPEEWNGLTLSGVQKLEDFLLKAHQTIAQKQVLQAGLHELENEKQNNTPGRDVLLQGINALSHWLQKQKIQGSSLGRWVVILSAVGGITAILTFFFGWPGLAGLVILIILTIYARKGHKAEEVRMREKDFQGTGLTSPEEWNIEEVAKSLGQLLDQLHQSTWEEKTRQKAEEYRKELQTVENQLKEVHQTYDEWLRQLKAMPELPKGDTRNYSGLYMFLVNLEKWQKAYQEAESLKEQRSTLNGQHTRLLEKINERFRQHHADDAADAQQAKATFRRLRQEEDQRKHHQKEVARRQETIDEREHQIGEYSRKLGEIYRKLGLEPDNKERVRHWVAQLDDYSKVKENYRYSERGLKEKEREMQAHSLYNDYKDQIHRYTLDQAHDHARHLEEKARELESLNEEITRIETLINEARQGNVLEDAIAERDQALDGLVSLYENNLSSLTGKLLIDQLKQETRERNRPAVFNRANELFNRITSGRYELKLEEKEEPAFMALDTVLREGQDLEELSTGTQIQLLLSVRLAYIETQETSLKLPVLADELLANSDDARAKAIIDALMEISRDGRQIFYFTAQGDEVAKWQTYAKDASDLDLKVLELTGEKAREKDYTPTYPLPEPGLQFQDVALPSGRDHREYGRQLQVPSYDPMTDQAEQLHLWYLIEDNRLLYQCLKNGIRYWGQLKSYLSYGGEIEDLDQKQIRKIKQLASLLERFQELYRQGRPRPVDKSVLEESGAVSDKFMEQVTQLLKELEGDPVRLLQALNQGRVPRFKKNKMEELERYFLDQGYIDDQPRVDEGEIWLHVKAQVSNMEVTIAEAERFFKDLSIK